MDELDPIVVDFHTDPETFKPYARDENLARPWAIPGTPHLEHRLGGLEKEHETGNVSYDPDNHQFMTKMRAAKVEKVADFIPPTEVYGDESGGVLMLGWGSTFGAIRASVNRSRANGVAVSHVHLRHLNPLPRDLSEIIGRFDRVVVPEMNGGQLAFLLQGKLGISVESLSKVKGKPFKISELEAVIVDLEWSKLMSVYPNLQPTDPSGQNRKDFATDQDVRWCPGCGDYAISLPSSGHCPHWGFRRNSLPLSVGLAVQVDFPTTWIPMECTPFTAEHQRLPPV